MPTLIHDAELPITKEDCLEWLGDDKLFFLICHKRDRQRIGQAWFNSLTIEDANKLIGTSFDPFHADNWLSVIKALMFLLEN